MRVSFLADQGNADGTIGGAELTMREFAAAAPEGVELAKDGEVVVIGNCVSFRPDLISLLRERRTVWYHNDLSPHINPELKAWLDEIAEHIFCSPLQRDRYGLDGHLIPPAIDLARFKDGSNGKRDGMVSIGAWQNPGKGQQSLLEYAQEHGEIDVYGTGPFAPTTPPLNFKGPLEPEQVPETLCGYSTFVYLPWDVEPFGRCVVEAWAAGCVLVVNRNVGATYWLTDHQEALRTAAADFWKLLTEGEMDGESQDVQEQHRVAGPHLRV